MNANKIIENLVAVWADQYQQDVTIRIGGRNASDVSKRNLLHDCDISAKI